MLAISPSVRLIDALDKKFADSMLTASDLLPAQHPRNLPGSPVLPWVRRFDTYLRRA